MPRLLESFGACRFVRLVRAIVNGHLQFVPDLLWNAPIWPNSRRAVTVTGLVAGPVLSFGLDLSPNSCLTIGSDASRIFGDI